MSIGLFDKVMVQSGSPLAFWAVHSDSTDLNGYVRKVANGLGCSDNLMEDIVDCLREIDWRVLTTALCLVSVSYLLSLLQRSHSHG